MTAITASRYVRMQREAFLPLLRRYHDHKDSPAKETEKHVLRAMEHPQTEVLLIRADGQDVGGLKTTKKRDGRYRLSRLFILPAYQSKGIASEAIRQMEARYPDATSWELDTILQERGNCHLYRKLGYVWTGHFTLCGPSKTLVDFVKKMPKE